MKNTRQGFTLVELLIVIVVIAIIAAIVIISYNGVSHRAGETLVADSVNKTNKQLELDKVVNGRYPTTLSSLSTSDKVDYQYTVSPDGQSYCLTGMHTTARDTAHFVDQTGKMQKGACPGHRANPLADNGAGDQQGNPSAVVAQRAGQCCGNGQQTVTLSQAPTAGNLLVAAVGWRSDSSTTASLSGSGWQTALATFQPQFETYGTAVFWKIVGTNEPTSITATTSSVSSSNNLLVQEFSLHDTTVGPPATSYKKDFWWDHGETGAVNVSAYNSLGIGFSTNYRGAHRGFMTGISWSNGLQDEYHIDNGSNISISTAWQQYSQPGAYSSVATWGDISGSATTAMATVGLVVFPFQ